MARTGGRDRGLFQRDGAWWIRWTCPLGHDHREKIDPKALARDEYRRRKVALKTEAYCLTRALEEKPTLFRDAADRYLAWAERERPRSYTFRVKALRHLLNAFGSKMLAEITRADVEAYQAGRRHAGAAGGTVNRERAVLSHLFTKAEAWGLVVANPVTKTERQKEADENPRPLTYDEAPRLFACLPSGKRAWPHWRELATLAIHTGLRLNELREQAWRDTDLPGAVLTVTRRKSKKPETIPLNATARAVLAGLERTAPVLFPGLPRKASDLFVRFAARAKRDDVTFHCLRDTFISRLAPDVSTPTLMALARHRDYRTTRRYVRVDGAHLRAAVERLADRGCVPDNPLVDLSLFVGSGGPKGKP